MMAGYLKLDGAASGSELRDEVERHYNRMYRDVPASRKLSADRLLCRPAQAMTFAATVRAALGQTCEALPDEVILDKLMNLRKRGEINTGERE